MKGLLLLSVLAIWTRSTFIVVLFKLMPTFAKDPAVPKLFLS